MNRTLIYFAILLLMAFPQTLVSSAEKRILPRFASIRSKEVNLRVGPGNTYPIEWVFKCSGMPVEVIAEFDTWRQIRDWEGASGWVHQSMIHGKRNVLISSPQVTLYKAPEDTSPPVAKLERGVICGLIKCRGDWCQVRIDTFKGWLRRQEIWGVYSQEKLG